MKRIILIAIIIMSLFSSNKSSAAGPVKWNVTNIHKAITMENDWLNVNRALDADDLKGRIILLDFWTYCCINCMHVIPDLKYLEGEFKEKVTVIGVHSAKFRNEKDRENIRSAILRNDIEHPVVNDSNFRIWSKFGVNAWPTLILINPDGIIANVYSGEGHREEIKKDIYALLDKYEGKINTAPLPIVLEKEKQPKTILSYPGKIEYVPSFEGADAIFISDSGNNRILGVDLNGKIFAEIGSGKRGLRNGGFDEAEFNNPQGLLYKDRALYVADTGNHVLRKIDFNTEDVKTIAGTGTRGNVRAVNKGNAMLTPMASPWDLEFYPNKDEIAIAMAGTHQIWTYDIKNQTVSILAGNGNEAIEDGSYPYNALAQTSGLSAFENRLYFVDSETSSLRVLENSRVRTLIGEGLFDFGYLEGKKGKALMQHPLGVFADGDGVYIADTYNHSIRRYDPLFNELKNFSGDGIRGSVQDTLLTSRYNEPGDLIKVKDKIYVADTNNNAIRIIDIKGNEVSTLQILPDEGQEADKSGPQYSDDLPNLVRLPETKVMPIEGAKIIISLDKGWKVNVDAPSEVTLFLIDQQKFVPIKTYPKDEIRKKQLLLPKLDNKKDYKLQGTIYYCENKPDSICLIQSFDKLINATDKTNNIEVPVKIGKGK